MKYLILLISLNSFAEGVSAGGGGGDARIETLVRRFGQVLRRIDNMDVRQEVRSAVSSIRRHYVENPPQIEFVEVLRYCDTNEPISEDKDAWGCPGRLQIKESFPIESDAQIFHELTRITPDLMLFDDNYEVSVHELELNGQALQTIRLDHYYSKDSYDYTQVQAMRDRFELTGSEATRIIDTNDYYKLEVYLIIIDGTLTEVIDHYYD